MADWYQTVVAEWQSVALATLTEIKADTYHTVVQALATNVVSDALKSEDGDTTRNPPPYLIAQVGKETVAEEGGVDAFYYRLPVKWVYVIDAPTAHSADATMDAPAYARSRLDLLRTALQSPSLTTCEWIGDDGVIDSSEDVAFARSDLKLYAAELTFEQGFLTVVS